MFTIKPRAVSRVCRTALNCLSSWARSSAFSASVAGSAIAMDGSISERGPAYPLITPIGTRRATLRASPA